MDRLKRVQKRAKKCSKDWGVWHMRKGWKYWGSSAMRREGLGLDLLTMFWYFRGGYREDGGPFFKNKSRGKD